MKASRGQLPAPAPCPLPGERGVDADSAALDGDDSLGVGQRLGIASAFLGDLATVILDEPVNGLAPGGICAV